MAFLYEKIDALREYGSCAPVPDYIPQNLNPIFELRHYQRKAFENFDRFFSVHAHRGIPFRRSLWRSRNEKKAQLLMKSGL